MEVRAKTVFFFKYRLYITGNMLWPTEIIKKK